MVLQRCLACNVMIPESFKTCACGHVFEDMKQIGGKRFSGYRAQLYFRLESKRMKVLTGRKRGSRVLVSSDEINERKGYNEESPRLSKTGAPFISSFRDEKKIANEHKPKKLHRSESPPSNLISFNRQTQNTVPAEKIDRLPKALAEINRRLLGQNSMWAGL